MDGCLQNKPFRAIIIGLGKIGFSMDRHLDPQKFILSHANALQSHPAFQLLAGVDSNLSSRKSFEKDFPSLTTFASIQDLKEEAADLLPVDLVVLAVPTENHESVFEEVLELKPQMILVEKPLSLSIENARSMIAKAKSKKIQIAVNYIRRYEPGAQKIRERLQNHEIGKIQKMVVWYSKGLFNNASHFVDLIHYWLNADLKAVDSKIQILNFRESQTMPGDLEPDFRIQIAGVDIYFLALEEAHYSVRDIEIYGEKGAIFYKQGGRNLEQYAVKEDSTFRGYKFLDPQGEKIPADLDRYQWHVISGLADNLTNQTCPLSSGDSALQTLEIVQKVKDLCRQKTA